jgi:hypothetical protein
VAVLPQCWNYAVRRTVDLQRPWRSLEVEASDVDFIMDATSTRKVASTR